MKLSSSMGKVLAGWWLPVTVSAVLATGAMLTPNASADEPPAGIRPGAQPGPTGSTINRQPVASPTPQPTSSPAPTPTPKPRVPCDTDGDGVADVSVNADRTAATVDIGSGHAQVFEGKAVGIKQTAPNQCEVWVSESGKGWDYVVVLTDRNGDGDFGDENEMERRSPR